MIAKGAGVGKRLRQTLIGAPERRRRVARAEIRPVNRAVGGTGNGPSDEHYRNAVDRLLCWADRRVGNGPGSPVGRRGPRATPGRG
jgi:hypothetical protein